VNTINGIWQKVIEYDSLYRAYQRASKGKRYSFESMKFRVNLEENLIQLQNELIWKTYIPQPLRLFTIHEPKERKIAAPEFRDRIVHHSLVAAVESYFESRFISDNCACRRGKGTHYAMHRMHTFTKRAHQEFGDFWILKGDVKKYFPSIRHDLLKGVIRRTISDRDVLWLIDSIIDSFGECGRGIPIGALTSQLFANIYLDALDHFVKETLSRKYYVRYMDDFVILGAAKEELRGVLLDVASFLSGSLDLTLNYRTGIWPERHGIDFCGYRIWSTHIKLRKRTVKTARKRLKAIAKRYPQPEAFEQARAIIVSFAGYAKHCSAYRSMKAVLEAATYRARGEKL